MKFYDKITLNDTFKTQIFFLLFSTMIFFIKRIAADMFFQVSHWKKEYVSIIFEVKRQKKMFRRKKMLTVNLPWNDSYVRL